MATNRSIRAGDSRDGHGCSSCASLHALAIIVVGGEHVATAPGGLPRVVVGDGDLPGIRPARAPAALRRLLGILHCLRDLVRDRVPAGHTVSALASGRGSVDRWRGGVLGWRVGARQLRRPGHVRRLGRRVPRLIIRLQHAQSKSTATLAIYRAGTRRTQSVVAPMCTAVARLWILRPAMGDQPAATAAAHKRSTSFIETRAPRNEAERRLPDLGDRLLRIITAPMIGPN